MRVAGIHFKTAGSAVKLSTLDTAGSSWTDLPNQEVAVRVTWQRAANGYRERSAFGLYF